MNHTDTTVRHVRVMAQVLQRIANLERLAPMPPDPPASATAEELVRHAMNVGKTLGVQMAAEMARVGLDGR